MPVEPYVSNIEFLFFPNKLDKVEQISYYDGETKQFKHYVKEQEYNDFETLEYGRGYQIYVSADCSITVTGTAPAKQVNLKTGWNLISGTPQELAKDTALIGVDYDRLLEYDKINSSLISATELTPGKAYYIRCVSDCVWDIPTKTSTTYFTYDGDGGRVRKITSDGVVTYVGSLFENRSGTEIKHIFAGSNRICSVEGSKAYYYHSDHLGSSSIITDETGAQVSYTEYKPFGEVFRHQGSYDTPYKFTGKELDESTGLYFYGARYYDPVIGRFTQPDTIVQDPGNPQTLNRYSYCNNNPVNYVDPTGHWSLKQWLGKIVGAVAAVVTFIATGGNAQAAYFAFNITDTIISGGQAIYYGADPVRVIGAIGVSIALNKFIPTFESSNLLLQVGVNAIRGAAIGAATAAAGGADVERGAIGGAIAGGATGFRQSEQFNNFMGGRGFVSNAQAAAIEQAAIAGDTQQAVDVSKGNLAGRMRAVDAVNRTAMRPVSSLENRSATGQISKTFTRSNNLRLFLKNLSTYSGIAFAACTIGGFAPAALVFGGIAAVSTGLEISLYSEHPMYDTSKETLKMSIGAKVGDPGSLVTDEIIDKILVPPENSL